MEYSWRRENFNIKPKRANEPFHRHLPRAIGIASHFPNVLHLLKTSCFPLLRVGCVRFVRDIDIQPCSYSGSFHLLHVAVSIRYGKIYYNNKMGLENGKRNC